MNALAPFFFLLFGCGGFILFISLISSFRTVQQNHVQLVERFGKFSRALDPGLQILTPFLEKVVADIDLAMQNLNFEADAVTKDKVVIKIKANLIYSVDRASVTEFYYKLSNPVETLSSYVENYVRSYVSSQTHEELLERREEISEYLIDHLDEKMMVWGMKITSFQVMDIVFPLEITGAMSKVVASERLKEAAQNEAESEKIKVVKEAEAEKESRILLGEGVAGERRAIIDGLKMSIDEMNDIPDLNTDEVENVVEDIVEQEESKDTVSLTVVILGAAADSFNPCAWSALIFMVTTLLSLKISNKKLWQIGLTYIAVIFLSYFAIGLGLMAFLGSISAWASILYTVLGIIIFLASLIELKDVFWYGKGFSLKIPEGSWKTIKKYVKRATIPAAITVGGLVSILEFGCTGGVYIPIIAMLAEGSTFALALLYLTIYNFIFVLPLLIMLALVANGLSYKKLEEFRQKHKRLMRLIIGLVMMGFSAWLLWNGIVN